MNLMQRRRTLMMAKKESGSIWLYNNGETSDVVGDWNTTGYKYGTIFSQSNGSTALSIYATSKYNIHGGRTFTSNNVLPSAYVGKTLHVKGYFRMNGDLKGGRSSYVYAFISDSVQDVSDVENIVASGAFTGEIHAYSPAGNDLEPGATVDFEMILPLTKTGYLSLAFYKGYNGLLYSYIKEVWVE